MYIDYELRQSLNERSKVKVELDVAFGELKIARRRVLELRQARDTRKRIAKTLSGSLTPQEREKLQELLDTYPSREELHKKLLAANEVFATQQEMYGQITARYRRANDKVVEKRAIHTNVYRKYSHAIANKLLVKVGRDTELVCHLKEDRLDVYFGGKGHPLGDGHAHWIFDQNGCLVFHRNPGKKRRQ